jgi:hypothetical protein
MISKKELVKKEMIAWVEEIIYLAQKGAEENAKSSRTVDNDSSGCKRARASGGNCLIVIDDDVSPVSSCSESFGIANNQSEVLYL